MRYDFIQDDRFAWPVRAMCRVLGVKPSGYYHLEKAEGQAELVRCEHDRKRKETNASIYPRRFD